MTIGLRCGLGGFYDLESHQSCKIKGLGFVTACDWREGSMESMKPSLALICIVNEDAIQRSWGSNTNQTWHRYYECSIHARGGHRHQREPFPSEQLRTLALPSKVVAGGMEIRQVKDLLGKHSSRELQMKENQQEIFSLDFNTTKQRSTQGLVQRLIIWE